MRRLVWADEASEGEQPLEQVKNCTCECVLCVFMDIFLCLHVRACTVCVCACVCACCLHVCLQMIHATRRCWRFQHDHSAVVWSQQRAIRYP